MAALAGILTAAGACDKQPVVATARPRATSLAGKPQVLFLLFGERGDPRLLPVATVVGPRITPITLDADGWRTFDRTYFAPDAPFAAYRDGAALPASRVRRGMWSEAEPLYALPGCRSLRPLAAATLLGDTSTTASVELLATSAPLPALPPRPPTTAADLDSARAFAARAGQRVGLTASMRDELELTARAIHTGASSHATLVIAYGEKGIGGGRNARHAFAIGDPAVDGYTPTFTHTATDSAPEFRRLIDHLDLTGDGVDELVLEGFREGGESFLVVMHFSGGRWRELARGTSSWCADVKR